MKHWVWIRAEIKNEIAALEKKMKCGPSICGMDDIQIRQRRISRVPLGTQKNVYGFLHTRSSGSHQAAIFNAAGRAAFGVPLALTRE